jgi:hypothetical protein
MMSHWFRWLAVLLVAVFAGTAPGEDDRGYVQVSFRENGKFDQPRNWAAVRDAIKDRKPDHVFFVVHGWRVGEKEADETVAALAKRLREQQGTETIQVIGVRWPSLLGEKNPLVDLAVKTAAQQISDALGKTETVKEAKERLTGFLNDPLNRAILRVALRFQLPPPEQLAEMIDNLDDPENVENLLVMLSYYEMKMRAARVGAGGLQDCLSELQAALPSTRFHLVGHSFGCKVCLACLVSDRREGKQVDSVTLLQGAVSSLCFAPRIDELISTPKGAYADVAKRVKGCISITYTKNDVALKVAYPGVSRAAGQIGELPGLHYKLKPGLYEALGGKGIARVAEIPQCEMCARDTPYKLRPGLNAIDADRFIQGHNDIRGSEVAWLIWSTARQRP